MSKMNKRSTARKRTPQQAVSQHTVAAAAAKKPVQAATTAVEHTATNGHAAAHNAHHSGHGEGEHDHAAAKSDRSYFMFWVYLMTDLLMFAGLFAAFAALRDSTFGGPGEKDIYSLPLVLSETLILLVSSYTSGLAVYYATKGKIKAVWGLLYATGILGASFLTLELTEFSHLIHEGNSYTRSAFLSSYFSLVGTHGLHIAAGLIWLIIVLGFLAKRGLANNMVRKITFFSTFWHFLDLVWIFIFSFVYLTGVSR